MQALTSHSMTLRVSLSITQFSLRLQTKGLSTRGVLREDLLGLSRCTSITAAGILEGSGVLPYVMDRMCTGKTSSTWRYLDMIVRSCSMSRPTSS